MFLVCCWMWCGFVFLFFFFFNEKTAYEFRISDGSSDVCSSDLSDDPAFAPERVTQADCEHWSQQVCAQLDAAFALLHSPRTWPDGLDEIVAQLQPQHEALKQLAEESSTRALGALRIRIHGDFHLGQVLVASGDVFLIDFEGEPARPDRQSVGEGKSVAVRVDPGGCRYHKKK